jgi:flagellin-like protein
MKKIWKIRKDSEAVSPVIATILMVAITVVLAAVLYVMVMGFGGTGTQTPTGAFSQAIKADATHEKVQFGVLTPDTIRSDVKILITKDGVAWANGVLPATGASGALTSATYSGTGVVAANITYVDLLDDNKIGSGDYLSIIPGSAGDFVVTMVFVPSGNQIDDISFVWA